MVANLNAMTLPAPSIPSAAASRHQPTLTSTRDAHALCRPHRSTWRGAPVRESTRPRALAQGLNHLPGQPARAHGQDVGPRSSADRIALAQPISGGLVALLSAVLAAGPGQAAGLLPEPANALSLPTWVIHVSSVLEWVVAMGLMWRYAEVTGNSTYRGMTWAMLPSFGGALAACTWHFFYNSPDLYFLVALQSSLTLLGNCTCMWAAYRIWKLSSSSSSPSS